MADGRRADGFLPAHLVEAATPVPARSVASDEFAPTPQTARQKRVEARMLELGDRHAARLGLSRRAFFQTASGMAAAFMAMNDIHGPLFEVAAAEAAEPAAAAARAAALSRQLVVDVHTHFLRDDTRLLGFLNLRKIPGQISPDLAGREPVLADVLYPNWFKEIYLDSDTRVALISGAPADDPANWFLTNTMIAEARDRVNREAGSRRALAHAVFAPGQPGWLDEVDRAIALKPDSWKGYTIGDVVDAAGAKWPWRMDDEKTVYPFYEKIQKAGITTVCVHKGLMPPGFEAEHPELLPFFRVDDVGKAAKDWPGLDFVIYHAGYRAYGGRANADRMLADFEARGRIDWVSDLADIPEKYGVSNVWADTGQVFAQTVVVEPRVAAAMMAILVRGLGPERVVWGTDAVWSGSPQWQIEGFRRLELPEDLRKRHGLPALGPADGALKTAILGGNSARMYGLPIRTASYDGDRLAALRTRYLAEGPTPSLRRYGVVAPA